MLQYYQICSNNDTELTLTYFTARSNLVPYAFVWKKGKTMDFLRNYCSLWFETSKRLSKWLEISVDIKILSLGGCMPPVPGLYTSIKSSKNCIKPDFKELSLKLATNAWSDKAFLLTSNFCPLGLSASAQGLYTCIKSWKKLYKVRLRRGFLKLATNEWSDKTFLLKSKLCPLGLSAPVPGLYTCIKSLKKMY